MLWKCSFESCEFLDHTILHGNSVLISAGPPCGGHRLRRLLTCLLVFLNVCLLCCLTSLTAGCYKGIVGPPARRFTVPPCVRSAPGPPHICFKIHKNFNWIFDRFWMPLGLHLGLDLAPKAAPESLSNGFQVEVLCWHRFGIDFSSILDPLGHQKLSSRLHENIFFKFLTILS